MTLTNILLVVVILLAAWVAAMYNGFIRSRNQADEALSDIDVQLKRRYDLIPNLVETAKGYMAHEASVFENVTKARAQAISAGEHSASSAKAGAENLLTGALKSLFAVSENYPQLRANENFLKLQEELADTENKIQAARRFYNTNVRDLNIKIESFPSNIIASVFGFKQMEFFDADDRETGPVSVKF